MARLFRTTLRSHLRDIAASVPNRCMGDDGGMHLPPTVRLPLSRRRKKGREKIPLPARPVRSLSETSAIGRHGGSDIDHDPKRLPDRHANRPHLTHLSATNPHAVDAESASMHTPGRLDADTAPPCFPRAKRATKPWHEWICMVVRPPSVCRTTDNANQCGSVGIEALGHCCFFLLNLKRFKERETSLKRRPIQPPQPGPSPPKKPSLGHTSRPRVGYTDGLETEAILPGHGDTRRGTCPRGAGGFPCMERTTIFG